MADGDGNEGGGTQTEPPKGGAAAGEADLGDAGKRALDEERRARGAAEKEARETKAELDRLRAASMSEQDKAVAKARDEGKAEATAEVQLERVRDKIEAKAANKLADPEDAAALLGDLSRFVVNGNIDSKAITSAIDALVKSKPYLSARPGNGSGEGGPRGGAPAATGSARIDQQIRRSAG